MHAPSGRPANTSARSGHSGESAPPAHGCRVTRSPRWAPYNPRWSFHCDPATVGFFDVAIEVCDATLPYVEDHLDEAGGAFLPGAYWCPWSSKLTREVPAP